MQCVVCIYPDKIKSIFRSWQQRSAVCFGVASEKGKKTTVYYCMVFIPSYIKLSTEENEWTFSDVFFSQMKTFLEANMLSFLEQGSLLEMFSQLWLQWKKILAKNFQTSPLTQTMNSFLTLLLFHFWQLFRGRMPCSYIGKQLRRNSLQL